jgi:UDP-N-acetylmuramate-alanine ligase
MSGLARIALDDGITVSGSDSKDSSVLIALTALGARVSNTHSAQIWQMLMLLFSQQLFLLLILSLWRRKNWVFLY